MYVYLSYCAFSYANFKSNVKLAANTEYAYIICNDTVISTVMRSGTKVTSWLWYYSYKAFTTWLLLHIFNMMMDSSGRVEVGYHGNPTIHDLRLAGLQ